MVIKLKREALLGSLARLNESAKDFAKRIDLSNVYLSELLNAHKSPSTIARDKIMNGLPDKKWDELFEIVNL